MDLFGKNNNGAEFSNCNKYRYKLWRIWDESRPKAMCIGLNPSTASGANNDPTITHLSLMLKRLGFGGLYMTNLYAFITPNPKDLLVCPDPIGENDIILSNVRELCDEVIVCWGSFKMSKDRIDQVLPRFPNAKCLGVNNDGSPYHPLAMMYKGLTKRPKLIDYIQ